MDFDRTHQGLIKTEVDGVELTLARGELAVRGKHAGDIARVVFEIRRVIKLYEIARIQRARVLVVMRVPGVLAGGDQGEVGRTVGAVLFENVLGIGLEFVLAHAGAGVAHRLDDAEAGDAGCLAQDGDLARALDGAELVEDRVEIGDGGLGSSLLEVRNEGLFAGRPAVPRVVLSGAGESRGVAGRGAAQHFRPVRGVDRAAVQGAPAGS